MKFSDIEQETWPDLKPFLDTCLIPVTGLSGLEEPWEVTQALEHLRDVMDWVEVPFKGRVVTYPAFHFNFEPSIMEAELNRLCSQIKRTAFKYVVVITADGRLVDLSLSEADLFLCKPAAEGQLKNQSQDVSSLVQSIWKADTD
jgi:23S rRNA (pseudouridine1915-N3)-methyltransferase